MAVVVFAEGWQQGVEFAVVVCGARVWSAVSAVGVGVGAGVVADGAAEEVDVGACHYECAGGCQ